jgi:GntR family transcriptional repressor for pyruvate dehydrogenase complex
MIPQNSNLLNRITRASIKDLALEELKRYIASGVVSPGDRLPSERDLAEQLGIGRSSVREALRILEAVGLIESRIGEGTFLTAQMGATFGRTVGFGLSLWGGVIMEILDARQFIEIESARMAAERATPADVQQLEAEVFRMEAAEEYRTYLAADMNFHRLIGAATHNQIVSNIVRNLIDLLEEVLSEAHTDQLVTKMEGRATHRAIYEAIVGRDMAEAARLMREHLLFATELWQAVVSLGATPAGNGD